MTFHEAAKLIISKVELSVEQKQQVLQHFNETDIACMGSPPPITGCYRELHEHEKIIGTCTITPSSV